LPSFVDTNIFIHYLVGYDPERYRHCHALIRSAEEGEADLQTSTLVIAELIWFLERPPLRTTPARVHKLITSLLHLAGLRLPDRDLVADALERHANSTMNFVDAYNAVLMQKRRITRIYSYDTDFDGMPGIERVEP